MLMMKEVDHLFARSAASFKILKHHIDSISKVTRFEKVSDVKNVIKYFLNGVPTEATANYYMVVSRNVSSAPRVTNNIIIRNYWIVMSKSIR
ncbi:hypothetical protein HHI36_013759 [Cryptolaemus montrouzieri]|uniref:Uncharacterized protein n=1 Tax=Cryptolaemus montrouzieri TaxID=559131 RepID=A0ABD2NIC2_9CUCU